MDDHLPIVKELSSKEKFFYLASPYTHRSAVVRAVRAHLVTEYSGALLSLGIKNFSPIGYCHPLAIRYSLPTDFEWWWSFNMGFMLPSIGLIVARIEGWRESKGIAAELAWCREAGRPIFFCVLKDDGGVSFERDGD